VGGSRRTAEDRPPAIVSAMSWLRVRPRLSLGLALLGLLVILLVDLVVPGYIVAGGYLVLVVFAAIALSQRAAVAISVAALALTLAVMTLQHRLTSGNLLLVWFGVLAAAGMFALVSLSNSVEALYESQRSGLRRESFLVRLVDALRPLGEPLAVEETATRLVGEQLKAERTAFYEADPAGSLVLRTAPEWREAATTPDVAAIPANAGALDLQAFAAEFARAPGRALVLPASDQEGMPAEKQLAALSAAGVRSCLAAPILEDGELVAAMVACAGAPREWTGDERELLEESVTRIWTEVRRARSDAALRETEARLRDTLDSSVDGLYRLDVRTGRFDYISPSVATITGVSMADLDKLDMPLALADIHPDDRAAAAAAADRLLTDGVAELECRWAKDGEYRWYLVVMRLTRDEHGEPLFHTGTFRDITGRRRLERNRAFVAALQDELTLVTSAQDVMDATGSRIGAELDVTFVYLAQFEPEHRDGVVSVIWSSGEAPPVPRRGRLSDYVSDEVIEALRRGETVVCHDTETDPRTNAAAYRTIGMRSRVMVPFRRGGDLVFTFSVAQPGARQWRDDEVELLQDVARRVTPRLERARAEEALQSSEARFRTIVTTAAEGISVMDGDGRITFVNDVFAGSLGYRAEEMIGRRPAEFGAGLEAQHWLEDELLQRVDERASQYDIRLAGKDGEGHWFLVSASPIHDGDGAFLGAVALFTGIDERKEQEAALALQAHLLENVHDAICALDASYRVIYWNEAAESLFGWTAEEAMGRHSRELLKATIPGSSWEEASAAMLLEGSFRGEVQYRHKNGHDIWADANSRIIRGADGEFEGLVGTFRDVSERRRTQEALAWEAARLRAIVDAAPVGLGIVAADGEVLLRNDILRKIWMGEAPVHSIDEFQAYQAYWPETGEQLRPEDWPAAKALQGGGSFADVVVDIDRFDGTRGTIVLSTAPIEDNGVILGAVTIAQDITRLREAEKALRFLTDEVRALHEAVVMDRSLSSIEMAAGVVTQAGLLLGSDGSSIFLLEEDGSLRRVAGVGTSDPEEVDDLVAEAIGDRATAMRTLQPPAREAGGSIGSVLLAVPLVIRGEVYGAMAFTYANRRSLEDDQIRIARAFADQAALAIENARLRARIEETAVEAERTRLARDLHDSVTQSLFAASLKAEALAGLLDDHEKALTAVEELRRLTRGSLAGMRTMLLEMRGGALEQTPLPELLRHLVEASASRIGADVKLAVDGYRRQLPPDVQTALYRIAQEALNNVARHARASAVWVELRDDEETVLLEVGDDGLGFEASAASAGHFGLLNMRERAESVGASFEMVTGPGRGTVVTVEWPFGEGDGDHD
jgi:PAS domain S-box-containing protein